MATFVPDPCQRAGSGLLLLQAKALYTVGRRGILFGPESHGQGSDLCVTGWVLRMGAATFALPFGQPAVHDGRVAQPLWHVPGRPFGPRVVLFAEKRGTIPSSVDPPFRAGWRSQVVYVVGSSGVAFPAALPLEVPRKTSRATRVLPRMNSKAPRTTTALGCGLTKLETRGAWRPREIAAPLRRTPERQMATQKRTNPAP